MLLKGKGLLCNIFVHANLLILLQVQTVIKSYSLMMRASNCYFRHAFSISGICQVIGHNFMTSRPRESLAAKDLLEREQRYRRTGGWWGEQ